jgi:hypothetical protein
MLTPPQIVWQAHGSPVVEGCVPHDSSCYLCGGRVERSKPVSDWMGSGFTDQARVACPVALHVCEACCYVTSRISPVLGREPKEGKKFGGNFRNYSHIWENGIGYQNASKGEKPLLREFLAREHAAPWFAAIADSGQKHVLPFARLNGPGRAGVVQFDDTEVHIPDDVSLVATLAGLLTLGVTKDELGSGDYYPRTIREHRETVQQFETINGHQRGSGWFTLALWLAQRDEEEHARQQSTKAARNPNRRAPARASIGVSVGAGRAPADDVLEPDPVQDQGGGAADGKRQRVGKRGPAPAADPRTGQLTIPGLD